MSEFDSKSDIEKMTSELTHFSSSAIFTHVERTQKQTDIPQGSPCAIQDTSAKPSSVNMNVRPLDSCCTPRSTKESKNIATTGPNEDETKNVSVSEILNMNGMTIQDDNVGSENIKKAVIFEGAQCKEDDSVEKNHVTGAVRFGATMSRADSKSKSELITPQRVKSDNSIFQKLFSRSSRGRTLTPSGRRSKFSNLIVQSAKGRPTLGHRFTIEALTHLSSHSITDGKLSCHGDEVVGRNQAVQDHDKEQSLPLMNTAVRADSDKKHRRGRSLFRSMEHKRSRARSPSKDRSGAGLKLRSVRRESPSPKPAKRKQWPRTLMTRSQREKKRNALDSNETEK